MSWVRQRTDVKIDEFSRIILQKGYWVLWEKATICPCVQKEGSGQPDFNCPLCLGKGKYWFDPQQIQGIMTNFNAQDYFNQTGEIVKGVSYFTTLPQNQLGFWDRLTNLNSTVRYSQVVVKGIANGTDFLKFQPTNIMYLRTVDTVYTLNIDFTYNQTNQVIDWSPDGLEPETGVQYAVEFFTNPRWVVIDLTNVIRDTLVKSKHPGITFVPLPVKAMVKLEFFL